MPSPEHKLIARAAAASFGGHPTVDRYWDDSRLNSVDIVSCANVPVNGVTSYATVGMSDSSLFKDGVELDVRAELVGACASSAVDFPNYLATAAFYVINSRHLAAPGVIFPDVLTIYEATNLQHVLLLPPFLWDARLATLPLKTKTVAWLLIIPISDSEMRFAIDRGVPALEDLFELHQIDIYNLFRPSVV